MTKPLFLTDLDDTLFQTARKLPNFASLKPSLSVATVDASGQPRSWMTQAQASFVDWALTSTELVPVTARDSAQFRRVQLLFQSWAVIAHGAVVLNPGGSVNEQWANRMILELQPVKEMLQAHLTAAEQFARESGIGAKVRLIYEYDTIPVYLGIKLVDNSTLRDLDLIRYELEAMLDPCLFYVHQNGNNLAIIPQCVSKAHAVAFVLQQLDASPMYRPIVGFGDSLSDLPFMHQGTWFAAPISSQVASAICPLPSKSISEFCV